MFKRGKRRGKVEVEIDVTVVERIEACNRWWEAKRAPQTGHWECLRCDSEHSASGEAPSNYWRVDEGPHVCTSCGSYAYTVSAPAPDGLDIEASIHTNQDVSGESHYMDALEAIGGASEGGHDRERAVIAGLVPEPDNQYDPNAIMVVIEGQKVGYIPKDDASEIGRRLGGKPIAVAARVGGGVEGSVIGVRLELP